MKCITIKQPWAYLICAGIKDIENRSWNTNFRGRVLIHASARPDLIKTAVEGQATVQEIQMFTALNEAEENELFGAIIGSVEIVNCISTKRNGNGSKSIWAKKDMFHWILRNPVLFKNPILNVKGRLSFWESGYEEIICPNCGEHLLYSHKVIEDSFSFGNFTHICESWI